MRIEKTRSRESEGLFSRLRMLGVLRNFQAESRGKMHIAGDTAKMFTSEGGAFTYQASKE